MTAPASQEKNFLGLPFSLALFCAALFGACFCFYLVSLKTAPLIFPDSQKYMEVAQDLSDFHLEKLHFRTWGYPMLLLVTGSAAVPTKTLFIVSLLIHLASVWMTAVLLGRLRLGKKAAGLFVFLMILPPYIQSAAYVLTENLTEFFLVAGFLTFMTGLNELKTKHLIWASLLFALTLFVRPAYQFMSFCIAALLLILSRRFPARGFIKAAVILSSFAAIILGSLVLFNGSKFGYFGVSPGLGHHLTTRTVPFIENAPEKYEPVRGMLIRTRNEQLLRDEDHEAWMYIWNASGKIMEATGRSFVELDKYLLGLNKELILSNPLAYLLEVLSAVNRYWFPYLETKNVFWQSGYLKLTWTVLHFAVAAVFFWQLLFFMMNLAHLNSKTVKSEDRPLLLAYFFAAVIVLYTMLISCAAEVGAPRFRSPTDGLIFFMIFAGFRLRRVILEAVRTP